jgi:hypothetical protein
MSSLPRELDFVSDPVATPERMNAATGYLLALIRGLQASRPDYDAAIAQLQTIGLERVTDVLTPIFDNAEAIQAALQSIKDLWSADLTVQEVQNNAVAAVTAAFEDYRNRYLGAFPAPPATTDNGEPITVGMTYFDTGLDAMRVMGAGGWKNAGSVVSAILNPFELTATAGQTTFVIPGGYDVGMIIVAVNGAMKGPLDYTASDGADVVFPAGLTAGDKVTGYAFGAIALSSVYTQAQSDARYRLIADSYTKTQVDGLVGAKADATGVYTKAASDGKYLTIAGNLAGLPDAAAARGNLGLGSAAVRSDTYFAAAANVYDKTTSDGKYALIADTVTIATGDARYLQIANAYDATASDGRYLQKGDNLAALADKAAARANLGLGSVATMGNTAVARLGTGATGMTIFAGTAAPANTLGADGDVYVQG